MKKSTNKIVPIKFGTDGWRAVIGEDFIPANVEKVIQAFCDWRQKISPDQRKVVVGFDRRCQSEETAHLVAEILAGNGFSARLASRYSPTPCVSWLVKLSEAVAGIMVTASHNPWQWNGIKFKEDYGGSASPGYTAEIEKIIRSNENQRTKIRKISFEEGKKKGLITLFEPTGEYAGHLQKMVDGGAIRKAGWKILHDPIHGAAAGFLKQILGEGVEEIRGESDPKFGGVNPEPIDRNLGQLMAKMRSGRWDVGLAHDGDADRIGAVDEKGNFINSHQIFALLLQHYVEDKGLKGPIVKSVSTTQMINKLCRLYGLPLTETAVGFKHICPELVRQNALMGGEESGGLSFAPHVHERDGILNALFLVEMMSVRKKRLGELIADLYRKIGSYFYERLDLHLKPDQMESFRNRLQTIKPSTLAGKKVASANLMDGFKYIFEDDSWLLIRASGTEPLVRIYSEAGSPGEVHRLIEAGEKIVYGS